MKRGWAALLGAMVTALAACSAPTQTGPAPKQQDTVVLGLGSEPGSLNPALGYAP